MKDQEIEEKITVIHRQSPVFINDRYDGYITFMQPEADDCGAPDIIEIHKSNIRQFMQQLEKFVADRGF